MKFLFQLLLVSLNLSSLSALLIDDIREINPTSVELNYSYKRVSDEDWNEIFSHQNTLEKIKIRMAHPHYLPNYDNALSDIRFPLVKEMDLSASRMRYRPSREWLTGQFINNAILLFISHQKNLEILNLDAWDFGGDDSIWRLSDENPSDFRILENLTHLKLLSVEGAHFQAENIEQINYTLFASLETFKGYSSNLKAVHWDIFAPNLRNLFLGESEINGTDIMHIAKLVNLENLDISDTKVTSGSIKKLTQLPNLINLLMRGLDLSKFDFSEFSSLESLDLLRCNLSIGSFNSLENLHNLKKLRLGIPKNNNINKAMLQELQLKLPNCIIEL